MDRNLIANKLGVENLEGFIIEEFLTGKIEAELEIERVLGVTFKEIENIDSDEVKVLRIISELIKNKSDISLISNDFLGLMLQGAKEINKSIFPKLSNENDDLDSLAKYILDYLDFHKTSDRMILSKLKNIRNQSVVRHFILSYLDKSAALFEILNEKCKLDGYTWGWINFEEGVSKVLMNHAWVVTSMKSDCNLKIELFELNKRSEIVELKTKIEYLNRDVIDLKYENERITDFYNKYYYKSQVLIQTTYFGDNLPFLFNLFNFFKQNNLLANGWSYFYCCMVIGNSETVSLTTSKKLNFVGRIFYHLCDYLTLHYKDEPFKFLQSKFLINGVSISDNFRTNHMKTTFDKNDYPELITIDDFFENQTKIYLKL